LLDRIDSVITISNHIRSHLLEVTNADPKTVQTVHYGFDPSPFDAVDSETVRETRAEFATGDEPLIGTVARLTEQKDLSTLLKAFEQVLEDHPDARLVVVGRGEEETPLRRLAEQLGINGRTTFTGFRRDVPELMHVFDVFALPSRSQGIGGVFLEAMAAETPVVASDTSAIPEVVADGETGVLCQPGDVDSFAESLSALVGNPDRMQRLGTAGRRRLEDCFTIERMVDETIDVYDSLLANS
jgi:glycosyltransferase involved in cell wall biosynthesis